MKPSALAAMWTMTFRRFLMSTDLRLATMTIPCRLPKNVAEAQALTRIHPVRRGLQRDSPVPAVNHTIRDQRPVVVSHTSRHDREPLRAPQALPARRSHQLRDLDRRYPAVI